MATHEEEMDGEQNPNTHMLDFRKFKLQSFREIIGLLKAYGVK